MHYLFYFLLTFIFSQGVHIYLLVSQRQSRKWSISAHAANNTRTHTLYIIGHVLAGASFVLFSYEFFYQLHRLPVIFYAACAGVLFDYIQALLPARGKTNAIHTIAAYIMWLLYVGVGLLGYVMISLNLIQKILAGCLFVAMLSVLTYTHFNQNKLYRKQMLMIALYFLAMLVLIV